MTLDQMKQAKAIADDNNETGLIENIGLFDGFGLPDFKPVYCTLRDVAGLIRWQCHQFNGKTDPIALNELATLGRRRFLIV